MKVYKINKLTDKQLDELKSSENYGVYHCTEWHNFIRTNFGWKVHYLIYKIESDYYCIPSVSKKRFFVNRVNVSLPFSYQVTPIKVSPDFVPEHTTKVEIANLEIHESLNIPGGVQKKLNSITVLKLNQFQNTKELFDSFNYKSIKYMVNRANKNNIKVSTDVSSTNLNDFFQLELETRYRQGSPMYNEMFFKNLFEIFKDSNEFRIRLIIARLDGKAIAGSVFIIGDKKAIYGYSASVNDKSIKKLGANELVLWLGIEEAFLNGCEEFDFGSSPLPLDGLRKYKEKWGGESFDLGYTFFPDNKTSTPDRFSYKAVLVSRILRMLPLNLFKKISPVILKSAI